MNPKLNVVRGVLATLAVFVVLASQSMQEVAEPGDRTTPMVMGFLVFFSVAFLHWLLIRYATAIDLFSPVAHNQIRAAGESGSQRGFFAGITSIGYLQVLTYAVSVAGYPLPTTGTTPLGIFFIGIVFLFLGLLARARGVVQFLISSRCESLHSRGAEPIQTAHLR